MNARMRFARRALGIAAALALVVSMLPAQALAYFDRGSVSVALGTTSIEVAAGRTTSVSVSVTPASDDQTPGCGMPKCPQSCSASCVDANGQCQCGGKDYETYYPSSVATSSDASVATAVVSGGTLTVTGKGAGTATITVRSSLRQFNDGEATLAVTVTGTADAASGASAAAAVDVPASATAQDSDDRLDYAERTVMGRPIHNVRITESCDAVARLAELAGVDGDVTFWAGDTSYHPAYSLTFNGQDVDAGALPATFDPTLAVSCEATGAMTQPLDGMSGFVVVDFACKGALPARAMVYASAAGALADDAAVALYSWDEAAKAFVREGAEAHVSGGYAVFEADEGKTYVVTSHDLTSEAKAVVTGGASSGESCCDEGMASGAAQDATVAPAGPLVVGAVVVVVAAVGIAIALVVRRSKRVPGADGGARVGSVDADKDGQDGRNEGESR